MDAEKLVAAIERFFLDIIGTLIPGLILLGGLWAIFGDTEVGHLTLKVPKSDAGWVLLVLSAYVAGHALTSLGEIFVTPLAGWWAGYLKRIPLIGKRVPSRITTDAEMKRKISERTTFQQFAKAMDVQVSAPEHVMALRNVAMTMADETRPTVLRFMFLSLLNLGVATALRVLAAVVAVRFAVTAAESRSTDGVWPTLALVIALGIAACPFIERRFSFYTSAMHLPFDAALAKLQQVKAVPKVNEPEPTAGVHQVIYLAGGLVSNWQDTVRRAVPDARFLDPRTHGLTAPDAFTAWDLAAIRKCDILFGYLETTNPGGYALSLEIGFAKALGKHVVLVDEKGAADPSAARSLRMVNAAADVRFERLDDALPYLRSRLGIR